MEEVLPNPRSASLKMLEFCKTTIIGHESAFYKVAMQDGEKPLNLSDLKNKDTMKRFLYVGAQTYFNSIYDSLAYKNNVHIITQFNEFVRLLNHNPICILNNLLHIFIALHEKLDRYKLSTSSYDNYMRSVDVCISEVFDEKLEDMIISYFDHECDNDETIEPLPEGKQQFYLSESPVETSASSFSQTFHSVHDNYKKIKRCDNCGKGKRPEANLQVCSWCKEVYYCNKECQREHWSKKHKNTCSKKYAKK